MRDLDGKVALVSGSGRGIGRAVAEKLASAGARVVVDDLDESVALNVVAAIKEAGGTAVGRFGDVTALDFGDRFVAAALGAFGTIDIIVNNAGYGWDAILQRTSDEQWEAMLAVHLSAPFRVLRSAQPVIAAAAQADAAQGGPIGRWSVITSRRLRVLKATSASLATQPAKLASSDWPRQSPRSGAAITSPSMPWRSASSAPA